MAVCSDYPRAYFPLERHTGLVRYRHFGDFAGARAHWERFLALAPDHPDAGEIRRAPAAVASS